MTVQPGTGLLLLVLVPLIYLVRRYIFSQPTKMIKMTNRVLAKTLEMYESNARHSSSNRNVAVMERELPTRESSPTASLSDADSPPPEPPTDILVPLPSTPADEHLHTVLDPQTCARRGKCYIWPESSLSSSRATKGLNRKEGHEIYYEVHGNGPRRGVLIMGLGNTSLSYASTVSHFTSPSSHNSHKYQILVLDNRGVGHSSTPRGPYTTSEMAADVLGVMKHLEWIPASTVVAGEKNEATQKEYERVHVVGISLGGMIAMELATMIPSHVASLTLGVTTPGYGFIRNLPPWVGLKTSIKLLGVKDRKRRMGYIIDMCFPHKWLKEPANLLPSRSQLALTTEGKTNEDVILELFEWRLQNMKPQPVMGNLAQSAAALTHHVPPERLAMLNEMVPKICILTGDEDSLVDPENSRYLHSVMPKSELVVWENTGHAINIQHPERFNELLQRVWDEAYLEV